MQLLDDVGSSRTEDLVAALEHRRAEVVDREVGELQVGAGRAVEDHEPALEREEVRRVVSAHPQRLVRSNCHVGIRLPVAHK